MELKATISEKNVILLEIFEQKLQKGFVKWQDRNDLSKIFLEKIDTLLTRTGIGLDTIKKYTIISNIPKEYTSVRIIKVVFDALRLSPEAGSGKKSKAGLPRK